MIEVLISSNLNEINKGFCYLQYALDVGIGSKIGRRLLNYWNKHNIVANSRVLNNMIQETLLLS